MSATDPDATEIGNLYALARTSLVNSVQHCIECGQKLIGKKNSLKHGEWLLWIEQNTDALGFSTDRTARLLMAAANRKLTSDLDDTTALTISRKIWGNSTPAPSSAKPKQVVATTPAAKVTDAPRPASQQIDPEHLIAQFTSEVRASGFDIARQINVAYLPRFIGRLREVIDEIEIETERWTKETRRPEEYPEMPACLIRT
jgi:hypothetical protein